MALALLVIGWGANHFTTLLPVYRETDHLSQTVVTAMFATYALGLMPALIIAARIGNRVGHRAVLRVVLVASVISSLVLLLGGAHSGMLFVGRAMYGACMGAAMAPGTTWIKEVSADRPAGTGARRAAVAVTLGFGGGPLVSGILAQWLPAPRVLPYVVHILLTLVVGALVWNAPEAARHDPLEVGAAASGPAALPHALRTRAFWWRIAPAAPWVFTCAALGLVTLPSLVSAQTGGLAVVFTGMMAGVTLGTGALVQQPARSLEARMPGLVSVLGAASATTGVLLVVLVDQVRSPALVVAVGMVLGCGYGLTLVGGLTRVEHLARPTELAMTNAVFYCLTYLGFFVPTIVAALAERWPLQRVLLGLAALAVLTLAATLLAARHHRRG